MIRKLQISGVHTKLNQDLEMYVHQKIGVLDRFLPKKYKDDAAIDVKLKELKAKKNSKDKYTCEVILKVPHDRITVHEKGTSMAEVIDLCEDKLKIQLKKYKNKHGGPRFHRRILHRIKRGPQRSLK